MKSLTLVLFLAFSTVLMAQKAPKFETITFKTSALCGECEERIENKLNYSKGIKFADLDIETKEVTVKYKTKKLTAKEVKEIVASIGYHAGDVERNKEAFNSLPGCCQDPNATCTKK